MPVDMARPANVVTTKAVCVARMYDLGDGSDLSKKDMSFSQWVSKQASLN